MKDRLIGWRDLKDRRYFSTFQSWDRVDSRKVNEGGFAGGAFIPEVARFFIERHATKPVREFHIWDPMAGTGTTGLVAEGYGIPSLMTDLSPTKPCIFMADAAKVYVAKIEDPPYHENVERDFPGLYRGHYAIPYPKGEEQVEGEHERMLFDLIIWHPPYSNIIQYSNKSSDLSNVKDSDEFLTMFFEAADNILKHLKPKGFLCLVIGDVWEDGAVVPLGFLSAYGIATYAPGGYKVKAIAIKDIKGNRPNKGYHLRLSRLARSGALDFKHEYLFSIQKG